MPRATISMSVIKRKMVEKLIKKVLHDRHYWRRMEFSELSELYASRVMRLMALSMVSVFVAIFLYQSGYSLMFIAVVFACMFALRGILAYPSAFVIARFGPKHGTMLANMLSIPALLSLAALESKGIPALMAYLVFHAASTSLYVISYHVDFSKIKHRLHVGKELGYMVILERIAMAVSPLLGGFIAYLFGPQATLVVGSLLFAIAALPLFMSPEPVRANQRITFRYIPLGKLYRGMIAYAALGWDFTATGIVWSLFIALAVFGTDSDAVYAQVGAVASVAILASLAAVKVYGALIDRHQGDKLLQFGTIGSALIHLVRPFISTATGVVLANATTETAKSAYSMPFYKGMYYQADNLPGYRIVYMAVMDIAVSAGAVLGLVILAALCAVIDEIGSMQVFYFITAFAVLAHMAHGFGALRVFR